MATLKAVFTADYLYSRQRGLLVLLSEGNDDIVNVEKDYYATFNLTVRLVGY